MPRLPGHFFVCNKWVYRNEIVKPVYRKSTRPNKRTCCRRRKSLGDIIVLSENLFDIPVNEIGETKVLKNVFNGHVIFDASRKPASENAIEEQHKVELELADEAREATYEVHPYKNLNAWRKLL